MPVNREENRYRICKINRCVLGLLGGTGYLLARYAISDAPYNEKLCTVAITSTFIIFPLVTVYAYHFIPFTFEPSTIFGVWITTWLFE